MHGKGLSLSSPSVILPPQHRAMLMSHTALGGMDAKVELRPPIARFRKRKRAAGSTKTKRRLSKIAYKAGAGSLLETLVAAQRIGPRIAKKALPADTFSADVAPRYTNG
jgi:hypothetical protein